MKSSILATFRCDRREYEKGPKIIVNDKVYTKRGENNNNETWNFFIYLSVFPTLNYVAGPALNMSVRNTISCTFINVPQPKTEYHRISQSANFIHFLRYGYECHSATVRSLQIFPQIAESFRWKRLALLPPSSARGVTAY